jgi:AraC-like DNA-binding protein
MSGCGFQIMQTTRPGLRAVLAETAHAFPRHSHDEYGIGLMEAGGQLSASGRGQVTAGAGDIITVNPGEVHDGEPLQGRPRRWRMLYLDPALMRSLGEGLDPATSGGSRGGTVDVEFTAPVLRSQPAALRFAATFRTLAHPSSLASEEALLALASALLAPVATKPVDVLHPGLLRARALLDDGSAGEELSLAFLAAEASLGRFQLLRSFAKCFGLTPHAYLMQRRADRARDMIAAGQSLATAAAEAGYADQAHMTRDFRRRYGLTPAAFARGR